MENIRACLTNNINSDIKNRINIINDEYIGYNLRIILWLNLRGYLHDEIYNDVKHKIEDNSKNIIKNKLNEKRYRKHRK